MSKAGVRFLKFKEDLMKDLKFKEEYNKLKARYEIISEIIKARREYIIRRKIF